MPEKRPKNLHILDLLFALLGFIANQKYLENLCFKKRSKLLKYRSKIHLFDYQRMALKSFCIYENTWRIFMDFLCTKVGLVRDAGKVLVAHKGISK